MRKMDRQQALEVYYTLMEIAAQFESVGMLKNTLSCRLMAEDLKARFSLTNEEITTGKVKYE